jgi:thiopeptide-type bacteriocin biosynthesis protein
MQLDTYEPEIERYGGPEGMLLAERLFCIDSEAVLNALEAPASHRAETESGPEDALAADPDGRWRLCLVNMDRILRGLGMSLTARSAVTAAARDSLAEELWADRALYRGIGERYRSERGVLEHLMGLDAPAEGRCRTTAPPSGVRALDGLGVPLPAVQQVAEDLRRAIEAGRIAASLPELAGTCLHMHANRLLRSAARPQELVLYDFLHRLYASRVARRGGAARP